MSSITRVNQTEIHWRELNPVTKPLFSYHQLVTNALCTGLSHDRPIRDLCTRIVVLTFSIIAYPLFSIIALIGKVIEYIFNTDFGYQNKLWALNDYARNGKIDAVQALLANTDFADDKLFDSLRAAANQNHNEIAEIILNKIRIGKLDVYQIAELQLGANFIFANGNRLIYQKIMEKLGKDPVLLSQEQPQGIPQILNTLLVE